MSDALKAAIEANDAGAVRAALGGVKDANVKLSNGETPVVLACKIGADKALEVLLEAKAKVAGKFSEHPFVIACAHQQHAVMQVLFDRKKVSEDAMENALMHLVRKGSPETLAFLLRQFKPAVGMKTVMLAGQAERPEAIRVLAAAGVDMNATEVVDHTRTPAMHRVIRTGNLATIRAMVESGADINARDEDGATPLMALADGAAELDRQVEGYQQYQARLKERAKENPAQAEALLNSEAAKRPCPPSAEEVIRGAIGLGADATLKDNGGSDAIDYYRLQCQRSKHTPENPKVVEVLRNAGATGDEATLKLFAAIDEGDAAAARRAIAAGAAVDRMNPAHGEEQTPLIVAARRGRGEIIDALLKAKADPNKAARNARPLLEACQQGDLAIVKRLLEAGADPAHRHPRDIAGDCAAMNAFETAQWMKRKEVMQHLKSIGADKLAAPGVPEAGVHSWENFDEVLVKGEVPVVAGAIAKMIGGKVETGVYGKTMRPGKRAFLVVRPVGMAWCNVFQLAPMVDRFDMETPQKLAGEISKAAEVPAIYIGYSDTSDAATSIRYEPGEKPRKKHGKESENDWLIDLAKKEKFMAGAFGPEVHAGKPIEILFSSFGAEAFDGVAYVTT